MHILNSIDSQNFLIWYLCSVALFSYLMFKASGFKSFWSLMLLFLFNSIMIIVGPILTLLLYFYLSKADQKRQRRNFKTLDMDRLKITYPIVTRDYRQGPLENLLMNEKSSQKRKIEILSYLKENFHKDDMRIFYNTLSGKGDESRLFCFGAINQMEKKLNRRINDLSNKISKCDDLIKKSEYESEMAHLYWDFVYYRLISKDLEAFYLNNAKLYVQKALKIDPDDMRLNLLLAKIDLKMKNFGESAKTFEKVISNPLYKDSALPYLAQVYFEKRDFKKLRQILDEIKDIKYNTKILSLTSLYKGRRCLIKNEM